MNSNDLLARMRVYAKANIYQIGCTSSEHLNIHAQQNRAFNLVFSLESEIVGKDVAVIGAGITGLTVSAALVAAGAEKVTLYDAKKSAMHLQAGNQTRFLHPNIAIWPERTFGYPVTHLPFLNWRSDTAGHVYKQLLKQWTVHQNLYSNKIDVKLGCLIKEVIPPQNASDTIMLKKSRGTDSCQILIIASGYGLERRPLSNTASYWRNDDLAQPILSEVQKKRYLVSGAGDGGLIEVLRLTIKDFHHQRFIQSVMYDARLFKKANKIRTQIQEAPRKEFEIWKRFTSLNQRSNQKFDFLKLKRSDTEVFLNATQNFPSGAKSQMLHRLCVALLIRRGIVKYIPGKLESVFENAQNEKIALIRNNSGETHLRVDEVIERHGTDPTLFKLFPKDKNLYSRLKAKWENKIDQTWNALYDREFLADEFQKSYLERGYKLGFLVTDDADIDTHLRNIYLRLDQEEISQKAREWVVQNFEGDLDDDWDGRAFHLTVENCDILQHGGRDFPDVRFSWRRYMTLSQLQLQFQLLALLTQLDALTPVQLLAQLRMLAQLQFNDEQFRERCLFLRTNSRKLVEHLFLNDDMPYQIFRIFPASNFERYLSKHFPPPTPTEAQSRPERLVSLDTHGFLISHADGAFNSEDDNDYFEIQNIDGMRQAHSLLRLPVLLEILMNSWPTTQAHGMGWAINRTQFENQNEHKGNLLLEWNPL